MSATMELLLVSSLAFAGGVLGILSRRHVQTLFTACGTPRGRLWMLCVGLFLSATVARAALEKPRISVCKQTPLSASQGR